MAALVLDRGKAPLLLHRLPPQRLHEPRIHHRHRALRWRRRRWVAVAAAVEVVEVVAVVEVVVAAAVGYCEERPLEAEGVQVAGGWGRGAGHRKWLGPGEREIERSRDGRHDSACMSRQTERRQRQRSVRAGRWR